MNPTQALKNRTARLVKESAKPVYSTESSPKEK